VIVLDTHAIFWLTTEPNRLSKAASRAIAAEARKSGLAISDISLWELAALIDVGRIRVLDSAERFLNGIAGRPELRVLEISPEIAVLATRFPADFPADPADRIIAATARAYGARLVTKDQRLQGSPLLQTIW